MSRPAGGRVVRVVLVELRRLSHIYRPRQWIGLLVGLTGCYLIYLANVSLTTSYTKPDVATSHFTFTAGCQSVDGCGDARISIYIAMPRCANPVTVFMFLAPRAGRSNAWLPPRSPVAFVTD